MTVGRTTWGIIGVSVGDSEREAFDQIAQTFAVSSTIDLSAEEVLGQRVPQLGGQAQRLDVDPLVVTVEHDPVVLETQAGANRPNP